MSDYFACLDLINFKMSSALLALSPAGATGAASGCGAGADSVTGAGSDTVEDAGASATGVCGFWYATPAGLKYCPYYSRS